MRAAYLMAGACVDGVFSESEYDAMCLSVA